MKNIFSETNVADHSYLTFATNVSKLYLSQILNTDIVLLC
jgi:hypothetical protein